MTPFDSAPGRATAGPHSAFLNPPSAELLPCQCAICAIHRQEDDEHAAVHQRAEDALRRAGVATQRPWWEVAAELLTKPQDFAEAFRPTAHPEPIYMYGANNAEQGADDTPAPSRDYVDYGLSIDLADAVSYGVISMDFASVEREDARAWLHGARWTDAEAVAIKRMAQEREKTAAERNFSAAINRTDRKPTTFVDEPSAGESPPVAVNKANDTLAGATASGRKAMPIGTGVLDYFPDALAAVAAVSKIGNDQHNPGQPLHWNRGKSTDEADCLIRHFVQRGTHDSDGARHSAKVAWRALALLQKEIEADSANDALAKRQAQHRADMETASYANTGTWKATRAAD